SEIVSFGPERLPSGPNVSDSDAIIIVEGRQDVLNLLRSGIKNAIAVEGTNVPKTVQELSKERALTAFVDGDRGGDLILTELLQLGGSSTARLLDEGDGVVTEVPVRELVDTLKTKKQTRAIVFDGIITQRILDIAAEMNMHSVVGTKMGTITKQPAGVVVWTR